MNYVLGILLIAGYGALAWLLMKDRLKKWEAIAQARNMQRNTVRWQMYQRLRSWRARGLILEPADPCEGVAQHCIEDGHETQIEEAKRTR